MTIYKGLGVNREASCAWGRRNRMLLGIRQLSRGSMKLEGTGHPTMSRLRLAVNKSAWIDDVRIEG
jgi:hypothetical protein